MRTISWTKPAIILVAAAIAAGCGSDDAAPANADAGLKAKCGNSKLDTGEACDGTLLGGKTCATATGMMGSTGTPTCDSSCHLVTKDCKSGAGGAMGTGGVMGNGGSVGGTAGKGGGGGTAGKGGGGASSGGTKADSGTDSGSGGSIPDASGD